MRLASAKCGAVSKGDKGMNPAPLTLDLTPRFTLTNARLLADACALAYQQPSQWQMTDAPARACRVLAFPGSRSVKDWITDGEFARTDVGEGMEVHHGFWDDLLADSSQIVAMGRENDLPLFVTGHSLGAARADRKSVV